MGLIDKTAHADLKKIGRIRNRFAHHHLSLDFDDAEIKRLCDALSLSHDFVDSATGKLIKRVYRSEASRLRERFLMVAISLADNFLLQAGATPKSAKG